MAKDKSPRPDGVIIELYKTLWHVIGADYFLMMHEAVNLRLFPTRVSEGLIALLYK